MEKLEIINAVSLYYEPQKKPDMIIEGLLPTGLTILAGDSKIGKSWMVLWLCIQISRGEPVWGFPTKKTKVLYLALEDRKWRLHERLHELTDDPPDMLELSLQALKIGQGLEEQIKDALNDYPDTEVVFIDTLQKVRDNISSNVNAYAQDYRDMASLKQIADDRGIAIVFVHHTRKEKDGGNVFNDMTGSTGIMGVADTAMILQKETHSGETATLHVTGRDIEEMQIRMRFKKPFWILTDDNPRKNLRKKETPPFIYQVADLILREKHFQGTISELMEKAGGTDLVPSAASRCLTTNYYEALEPLGIRYEFKRTGSARLITLSLDDANDANDTNDGISGTEKTASQDIVNDAEMPLPESASLPSLPSLPSHEGWRTLSIGEELSFSAG